MATWIFPGDPEVYNRRGAVRALPQLRWRATRHAKEIPAGDRVHMWEAGACGGIVAVAKVLDRLRPRPSDLADARFILRLEELGGNPPKVLLGIQQVIDTPASRKEWRAVPQLSGLSILRCWQGTNFPVTAEEDDVLRIVLAFR